MLVATASVGSEGAIGTIAGNWLRARLHASDGPGGWGRLTDCGPAFSAAPWRKSEAINDLLTRYHMALMCQVQQTSLCNSVHDATLGA